MPDLNLRELVSRIRSELEDVDRQRQADSKPALLTLESVDLELKFTVASSDSTKGGFDLKIVAVGREGGVREEAVQTIRLQYKVAKDAKGNSPVGGRAHSSSPPQPDDAVGALE